MLNEWWEKEEIPEEETLARVVLIYKKGDASLCENYRPISLLNTMYKLIAAIVKIRLEEGIEKNLQDTQYGFQERKGNSRCII